MLITSSIIVGSVLYAGLKVIQKYKRGIFGEKKFVTLIRGEDQTVLIAKKQLVAKTVSVKAALTKGNKGTDNRLIVDSREEQFKAISSTLNIDKVNELKRKLNRDFTIASISVVFASAGALFYSPLSLLSLPGLLWINAVIAKDSYHAFQQGRGVGADALGALFHTGAIVTGNYFAAALAGSFSRFSKKILSKTEDHSKQSLINVFGNQTRFVWLFTDGIELEVSVDTLTPGNIIVVHAGEMIAVDGTITSGVATIDQHILTGESQPAEKEVGEQVFASTVVLSGKIKVRVEKAGKETVADQIGEILNKTTDFKQQILSQGEDIADRSARMTIGLSLLIFPFFGATTAITVLNSSFGFYMRALGPLSMLTFLNFASQKGLLIKDGRSLQLLNQVDTVVFDKTGTLTLEQPHVTNIYTCCEIDEETLLNYAAAAENKQTHPVALAIREIATQRHLTLPVIGEVNYEIGYGLRVSIENKLIRIGSKRFMEMSGISIPDEIIHIYQEGHEQGYSFVYLAVNDQLWGAIELHTTIRPEAKHVIEQLRQRNISMCIISGDHEKPTKQLAKEVGIEHYFAETLPENKAKLIEQLQLSGKSVCFVGDGINDSIALKKANVSVSLRGASSVATDTAQIILMNQNLNQLIQAFDVAQNFEKNMKLNIMSTVIPGVITLYGAFFLGFGVVSSVILNDIGVVIGASNAIWPWLREQSKKKNPPIQREIDCGEPGRVGKRNNWE